MDALFWGLIGFIILMAVLGFIFRTFLKLALILIVAAILFTLFFGSGEGIVDKAKAFLSDEDGQRVEELYDDFRDRSEGPIDGDALLSSIKDWVSGKADGGKLKEGLLSFAEENLSAENLNKALDLIKESIENGSITEELVQFAEDNFTAEKAQAFLEMIKQYINEES
jgi:hypothetical protein